MARSIVHIFGASGAGTSTLGRALRDQAGFFFMDTDDYFWLPTDPPYTTRRDAAQRLERIRQDLAPQDRVVLSGSLTGWGDPLIPCFTLAVRLHTDTALRLTRLAARERAHFGPRIEPGGDMYEAHLAFLRWAAAYDDGDLTLRSRAEHDLWQRQLPCKLLHLNGADSPEHNLALMQPWL